MNNIIKVLIIFVILFFCNYTASSQIRINEICASNSTSYYDEDADSPDWIELYNYSDEPVNLKDWRISDKNDYENAWQFPDTIIQPDQYLLVMASGKDRVSENIKISSNGLNTTTYNNNDNLSMLYIELEGNNEFTVKFNSFEFEIDSANLYSFAGLILKDKLESKSRMICLNLLNDNIKVASVLSRTSEEIYRSHGNFYSSFYSKYYTYSLKIVDDSVYAIIYDQMNYPLVTKKFIFENLEEYYVGLTVVSRDTNNFENVNVDEIKINNNIIDIQDLKKKQFFDTKIFFEKQKYLHSNFALNSKSDSLFLFKNNLLADKLHFNNLGQNETFGNYNNNIGYLTEPTPNSINSKGFLEKLMIETLDSINTLFNDNIEMNINEDNLYFGKGISEVDSNFQLLTSISTNQTKLLNVKKISDEKQESDVKYLSLINTKDILNEGFHIFIYADSIELFNEYYGVIGASHSNKWIPAYCTVINNNNIIFDNQIELRKHGNVSNSGRLQSSMRIDFKDEDKYGQFSNEIFTYKEITYGKNINLRNGGNDYKLFLRDAITNNVSRELELEWSDYNTSMVYLNSEFWGLYNLRERIDDDYLSEKYELEKEDINYFENDLWVKYGTNSDLLELESEMNFLNAEEIYHYADSLINLLSFIDYLFVESFVVNHDWPHNNVNAWRGGNSKWKFILNDVDYSLKLKGISYNVNNLKDIYENNNTFISKLFTKLFKNEIFRNNFLNRICDNINTSFSPTKLYSAYEVFKNKIKPLSIIQNNRWPETMINWENEVTIIDRFFTRRQQFYLDYTIEQVGLPGISNLTLSTYPKNSGTFKVNTINVDTSDWEGRYFQSIPVTITAIPKHGMKFIKWNHDSLGTETTITTTLPETYYLEAIYEKSDPTNNDTYIVINEIMYNADKDADTKDWIELYNAGKQPVNLNGWSLLDEDNMHNKFVIEEDYSIQPDEYLILTREQTEFEKYITIENKKTGDFDFGLGGNDILRLYDESGQLRDSVNYDNDMPWPIDADGSGYTIELINPSLDNNLATNWEKSQDLLGTPGEINSNYDSLKSNVNYDKIDDYITIRQLEKMISIYSNSSINKIQLFDVLGKLIKDIKYQYINSKYTSFDKNNLAKGVYILLIETDNKAKSFKLIID